MTAPVFTITKFRAVDDPHGRRVQVTLDELRALLSHFAVLSNKKAGPLWSPATFVNDYREAEDGANIEAVSSFTLDLDHAEPDWDYLRSQDVCIFAHTTCRHTDSNPHWRLVVPLAEPVIAAHFRDLWRFGTEKFAPNTDQSAKDIGRAYWLPAHPPGGRGQFVQIEGSRLLDIWSVIPFWWDEPEPTPRQKRTERTDSGDQVQRRAQAMFDKWTDEIAAMPPESGRHTALFAKARATGGLIASGLLNESEATDDLYSACESNNLVTDDGERSVRRCITDGITLGQAAPWDPTDLGDSPNWTPTQQDAASTHTVPDDDLPDDPTALKGLVRKARARAEAAEARAEVMGTIMLLERRVRALPGIESNTKEAAIVLAHELPARQRLGHPTPYKPWCEGLGRRIGVSADTLRRHAKRLAKPGVWFDWRTVADGPHHDHSELEPYIQGDAPTHLRAALDTLTRLDKPGKGHGGARVRCPDHPDAPLVEQHTLRCSVCRRIVDQHTHLVHPRPEPPEPESEGTQHDAASPESPVVESTQHDARPCRYSA